MGFTASGFRCNPAPEDCSVCSDPPPLASPREARKRSCLSEARSMRAAAGESGRLDVRLPVPVFCCNCEVVAKPKMRKRNLSTFFRLKFFCLYCNLQGMPGIMVRVCSVVTLTGRTAVTECKLPFDGCPLTQRLKSLVASARCADSISGLNAARQQGYSDDGQEKRLGWQEEE